LKQGEGRPRESPIQCWGGGGNHMYIYCPHRGEKVSIVHNVQQSNTMEDMGKNVPRIDASLDNNKVEFQSHMIEVEGKIKNQTIDILIYSGASHSYIDPKMVGIFHFPRSKLRKSWLVQITTRDKRKINEMVNVNVLTCIE
jgi:hypothetical protein